MLNILGFLWKLNKLLPYQISFWTDLVLGNITEPLMNHNFQKYWGHIWQEKMELSESISVHTDCHTIYPDYFPWELFTEVCSAWQLMAFKTE